MAALSTLRKPVVAVRGLISLLSPRGVLSRLFTVFPPSVRGLLRLLGLLFVLVNIKSLPLMWHVRSSPPPPHPAPPLPSFTRSSDTRKSVNSPALENG